jgi:DHA3 family tetracycline resistance protein-like MFS transporter
VAGAVLTILAVRFVERRVDSTSPLAIGRALFLVTAVISVALIGFALSPFLVLSLGLYLLISVLRNVQEPLQRGWINQKLDPQVRATVHSMFGQVDAIGQVMGGPIVAGIASAGSAIAALVTSGLLLTPALFFIERANSQSKDELEVSTSSLPAD